jgi:hypothetical protein
MSGVRLMSCLMSNSYMVTFEIITGVNVSVMSVLVFHIDLRVQQQNP